MIHNAQLGTIHDVPFGPRLTSSHLLIRPRSPLEHLLTPDRLSPIAFVAEDATGVVFRPTCSTRSRDAHRCQSVRHLGMGVAVDVPLEDLLDEFRLLRVNFYSFADDDGPTCIVRAGRVDSPTSSTGHTLSQGPPQTRTRRLSRRGGRRDSLWPTGPPHARRPPDFGDGGRGRVTKRRTLTPGLTMTLSLNVDDLARALVEAARDTLRADDVGRSVPPSRRTTSQLVVRARQIDSERGPTYVHHVTF